MSLLGYLILMSNSSGIALIILIIFSGVKILSLVILGPVRGIDFHENQPLFVSGGDDYKIKVSDGFDYIRNFNPTKFRYEAHISILAMFGWVLRTV